MMKRANRSDTGRAAPGWSAASAHTTRSGSRRVAADSDESAANPRIFVRRARVAAASECWAQRAPRNRCRAQIAARSSLLRTRKALVSIAASRDATPGLGASIQQRVNRSRHGSSTASERMSASIRCSSVCLSRGTKAISGLDMSHAARCSRSENPRRHSFLR